MRRQSCRIKQERAGADIRPDPNLHPVAQRWVARNRRTMGKPHTKPKRVKIPLLGRCTEGGAEAGRASWSSRGPSTIRNAPRSGESAAPRTGPPTSCHAAPMRPSSTALSRLMKNLTEGYKANGMPRSPAGSARGPSVAGGVHARWFPAGAGLPVPPLTRSAKTTGRRSGPAVFEEERPGPHAPRQPGPRCRKPPAPCRSGRAWTSRSRPHPEASPG